jgi:hypothetical protein
VIRGNHESLSVPADPRAYGKWTRNRPAGRQPASPLAKLFWPKPPI